MEIKTKFNIGDEVYVIYEDKCTKFNVKGITVRVTNEYGIEVLYSLDNCLIKQFRYEESVFSSKEELLKSL